MPKMLLGLCCLLVFPFSTPAGPPEEASGRMLLAADPVGDGLRQYRREPKQAARLAWLQKLAPTRDPRVALVLWEEGPKERRISTIWECRMIGLLNRHFVPDAEDGGEKQDVRDWWKANEADLRRRAKQLH
jgi:hypothetical protein